MTLLELHDLTIVLEKVAAFEFVAPPTVPGAAPETNTAKSIRIIMDGGTEFVIHGRGTTAAFLRAMKKHSASYSKD